MLARRFFETRPRMSHLTVAQRQTRDDPLLLEEIDGAIDGRERDLGIDRMRTAKHFLRVWMILCFGQHARNHAPLPGHAQSMIGAEPLDAGARLVDRAGHREGLSAVPAKAWSASVGRLSRL